VLTGANCTIKVTFSPTATGTRTGAVTITDNAAGEPAHGEPEWHRGASGDTSGHLHPDGDGDTDIWVEHSDTHHRFDTHG
jgi:hypothetical protein